MSTTEILEAAIALSPKERIALIEGIWASLPETDDLGIPADLARELEERVAAFRRDGDPGSPWEEVKSRITSRRK